MDSRKPVSSCTPRDFDTLCQFWAETIIGPEWMIIFVLAEAGQGAELPEEIISQELNVHPSFVTAHSKRLEKLGFVGRRSAVGSKGVTL